MDPADVIGKTCHVDRTPASCLFYPATSDVSCQLAPGRWPTSTCHRLCRVTTLPAIKVLQESTSKLAVTSLDARGCLSHEICKRGPLAWQPLVKTLANHQEHVPTR
ncbi:hypothetical protein C0Q70_04071 [Pomacea canaliculata]|uniref:Uncharacterized protein n=1 Tax=Pomacea canaliculata TaxID=400727 RepID=A0A2T7PUI9_POMCA|nr:hypothetical protein C0Q70_04071 [Pomacea canaliculata]